MSAAYRIFARRGKWQGEYPMEVRVQENQLAAG